MGHRGPLAGVPGQRVGGLATDLGDGVAQPAGRSPRLGQRPGVALAEQVGLDYWTVRDYVEKFRAKGFVISLPIPSEAQTS